MNQQPCYRESAESRAERHRRVILLPGQEICACGQITAPGERYKCINCGHPGCVRCLHWADDTGAADLEGDWVCGDQCEIEWLQSLAQEEERSHRLYQDWMAKRIQAVRLRQTG